ncbi:MAG: tRNA lysidine(34) synthetase TilS [Lachnospiraceae bacterium]|nr:tRNA lysidine(34) synthetase TilS [Lachnospiraceae bacterium]
MAYVEKHNMFEENDYVVAGVSGGADSVCLLFVLQEIRKRIPIEIHVVHINHGIRQEAGEDAAYVASLCEHFGLPFTLVEEDVAKLAKEQKLSEEEAGRQVRYRAFYQVLAKEACGRKGKIAVAHNSNDCAETTLFHLFRGSGLKGLSGIRPVRDRVVRPILCLERVEIEAYLEQNQIHYCIDKTNFEDNYTRNRIRHHILPYAEQEICQGAVAHVTEACEKISDAYDFLEDMVKEAFHQCVKVENKKYHINAQLLAGIHKTLKSYLLLEVISQAAGRHKDIEGIHVEQVENLFNKQSGRQLHLPYGLCAVREYEGVCIAKNEAFKPKALAEYVIDEEKKRLLEQGEVLSIPLDNDNKLEIRLFCGIKEENIIAKTYTKWFDYDKIKGNILVRGRRTGDYLTINQKHERKTLKAFFIDEKIPKEERDCSYLVTEDSHVIWIVGNRISSYYKVSRDTKNIMEIKYIGGFKDGRTC